jgi:TatD DNase family protein
MFIDTHAHLMFDQFSGEVDSVLERAFRADIKKIINVGCDTASSFKAYEMSLKYKNIYATLGLHPYDSLEASDSLMEEWEELISMNKKIVALGECGLDYFKAKVSVEDQKKAFRMQLKLAQRVGLPVVVHNREADYDSLSILKEFDGSDGLPKVRAVFHCYGSNVEFARELWRLGYYTSFTGIITYPNAFDLQAVVEEVPLDAFMIETDCPYLAPQKYRGGRNEPSYVVEVAKKIADIRGLSFNEVGRISTENALEFFLRLR